MFAEEENGDEGKMVAITHTNTKNTLQKHLDTHNHIVSRNSNFFVFYFIFVY